MTRELKSSKNWVEMEMLLEQNVNKLMGVAGTKEDLIDWGGTFSKSLKLLFIFERLTGSVLE